MHIKIGVMMELNCAVIPIDLIQVKILIKMFRKWHSPLKLLEKSLLLSQSKSGILFDIHNL